MNIEITENKGGYSAYITTEDSKEWMLTMFHKRAKFGTWSYLTSFKHVAEICQSYGLDVTQTMAQNLPNQ